MQQTNKKFKLVSNKKTRTILPNMFTLVGVCIGLTSIKFAFDERFGLAIICIIVVQIAGLVARRIVCESNKDQELKQGERIGMIRFGSRADIYYENYQPLVKVGQKAISGETLLAKK